MKFIIKTTGIADRLSVLVSSPQSGCCGLTVGTAGPFPAGRRLKRRGHWRVNSVYHQRSILGFDEIAFSHLKNNIEKVMLTYGNQLNKVGVIKSLKENFVIKASPIPSLLFYTRYNDRICFPLGIIPVDVSMYSPDVSWA